MKKTLTILLSLLALNISAQSKGLFEVHDFGNFKLHVYYTNDVMLDASYIIEGENALVTLEQPLFKDNVAEYNAYLTKLHKPVEQRISDYLLWRTADQPITMAEGMPDFSSNGVYAEMMKGFAKSFGNDIVSLPTGKKTEVAFGTTQTYAGIPFTFYHGASNDFPGASIFIGNRVWFSHWAPTKTHISHLYISSPEAIDAQIAALEQSLKSNAETFIGAHGGAVKTGEVKFRINYLKNMKALISKNETGESFIKAMKEAFPNLPNSECLEELAKALYSNRK